MFGRTLLRTAVSASSMIAPVRSFATLFGRTPFTASTTTVSSSLVQPVSFLPMTVPVPASSPFGLLQVLQRRGVTYGQEYQPSVLKRKRKFGFLKRVNTVGGRKCLARRMLKGRKRLSW